MATEWITAQNFDSVSAGLEGDITVGSTNFYEQEILGEIFAQMLESNGATVERKFQLGNREIVFPALEAGEIDVLAEYAATALEFVNGGAGQATTDPVATTDALRAALEPKALAALNYAAATDQNGFVVTQATADQYGLTKISDLAQPAPPRRASSVPTTRAPGLAPGVRDFGASQSRRRGTSWRDGLSRSRWSR